jgi:hypothetical protein
VITRWRAEVDHRYGGLLANADPRQPTDAEIIRAFEDACRGDQELAAGCEAGRADAVAEEPSARACRPFCDGSAGRTCRSAYELGLTDGRT